jgi:hypothetical protein
MKARIGVLLAVVLVLAATLIIAAGNDLSETPLAAALGSWCAALLMAAALIAIAPRRWWIVPAAISALYALACVSLALFQLGAPLGLDADFILAAPKDSAKTLVKIIGGPATVLMVLAVAALTIAIAVSLRALTPRSKRFALIAAILAIPTLAFLGLPHSYLRKPPHLRGGESIRPVAIHYKPLPQTNGESVFVLQLESVNGLIADPGYQIHGQPVPTDPLSGMRELGRRGFFFPHFWGGTVSTHRAQETILCGAVRNVHAPYFDQLIPWDGKCLPALLRDAGYKTVFLSSFPDRTFGETGKFMQRAGFEDIRFAGALMKPGDPLTRWGYEENAFYTRAFEYLRAHYAPGTPLFVYLAVCAHHYGFTREAQTDAAYLLGDELKKIHQYLASQRLQDQSLLTFDRLLRDYKRGTAHAFYVPDHSFPLGLYGGSAPSMGATIDNFITPFVYVPADRRAADLGVGRTIEKMHAQTDLVPTIAELVSGTPYPNSLVPFLQRTPSQRADYEDCHFMTQPYTGRWLFIARGNAAYQYHVSTQSFREFRIGGRPLRQALVGEATMTYDEFERRYGCKRFPER